MLARRMLLLIALLMGLTALAVSIAPPPPAPRTTTTAPAEPPVAAPSPTPSPTASGEPEIRTVSADRTGQVIRVEFGSTVRVRVVGSHPGAVQIGVDGPIEDFEPQSPAEFELLIDRRELNEPIRVLDGPEVGRITTGS